MFTQSDETVIWKHVQQARTDLVVYVETLSQDQWNQPSLCEGWLVRDVLAHLILEYHYTAAHSWKDFIRSGFRINAFMKQTAITLGRKSSSELIRQFRDMIDEQHTPSAIPVMNVLVDLLVHEQDMRLGLRQPKDMPLDALRLVFTHWEPTAFNMGEKITGVTARVKGLQFVAEDLGITKGVGPEVVGSAQDILLVLAGRTISLPKLSGKGLPVLEARLGS